jgi:hypothetical protein
MIAEEYKDPNNPIPLFNMEMNRTTRCIINSFIQTTPKFLTHLKSATFSKKTLNEEELTQEFVALLRREINGLQYPFLVGQEYKDIYNNSKGRTDFYFYPIEEGKSTQSVFSGEAKRLPSPPPLEREQEYVIGNDKNGGIERFKIEKHGKGLKESCVLGFVEKEGFQFWSSKINSWIIALAQKNSDWNNSEILNMVQEKAQYYISTSSVLRVNDPILLNHFWIYMGIN